MQDHREREREIEKTRGVSPAGTALSEEHVGIL
jgi:hypothetical protein